MLSTKRNASQSSRILTAATLRAYWWLKIMNEDVILEIGGTIRELRQMRQISVRSLAARINRSPAFLSQLERNISKPSLKDIYAISAALDVTVSYFLQDVVQGPEEERGCVLRRENYRSIENDGVLTEFLSPRMRDGIEFCRTTFLPLSSTKSNKFDRLGYETGVILSGELIMTFSGRTFTLREGDTYSFKLDEFHSSKNPSKTRSAVLLWTINYLS
jgi:transcriptional regulator with XRE-family HTH domain